MPVVLSRPFARLLRAQPAIDRAEYRADLAAEQRQDADHNDRNQYQDQRVLDQALALFLGEKAANHTIATFLGYREGCENYFWIIHRRAKFSMTITIAPFIKERLQFDWSRSSLAESGELELGEATVDCAKHCADSAAHECQNRYYHNHNQHQYHPILNQTLAILFGEISV